MYPHIVKSLYTDTDSIFLSEPLNNNYVGKGLGKFKQEYGGLILKAYFVAPKLYYLKLYDAIDINGNFKRIISKNKGYKGSLTDEQFNNISCGIKLEKIFEKNKR